VGVVFLVDVLDVALTLVLGDGVAHVVDVEAQCLGEVVETLQLQARQRLDHVIRSRFGRKVRDYGAKRPEPRPRAALRPSIRAQRFARAQRTAYSCRSPAPPLSKIPALWPSQTPDV